MVSCSPRDRRVVGVILSLQLPVHRDARFDFVYNVYNVSNVAVCFPCFWIDFMRSYARSLLGMLVLIAFAIGFVRSKPAGGADEVKADKSAKPRAICEDWPKPDFVFFITGRQHGYIEPCGCTGLASQKGGLARRQTLYRQLKSRGWDVVPIDVGNQIRRYGPQPAIKFQTTLSALKAMEYQAVGLGPDDLRIETGELLSEIADPSATPMVCANLTIFDLPISDGHKIISVGKHRVGVSAVIGKNEQRGIRNDDFLFTDPVESLTQIDAKLESEKCNIRVLLSHASIEETERIVQANEATKRFRIVVTAGGADEPALAPQRIGDSQSFLIQTGKKGMYVGVLGIFADSDTPIRYERVPLDARFVDSKEMLASLKVYQDRLKEAYLRDWSELGLKPVPHPSGHRFVGSEACKDCHEHAFEIWEKTPHHHATDAIAFPTERSSIPRHFDPECLSCHVTGWHPQDYYPYASGYVGFEQSKLLHGNGCENCHGPGSGHVDAENGDGNYTEAQSEAFRKGMQLPLAKAQQHCLQCHDLDNDPNFQEEGAFEKYWKKIEHYE